MSERTPDWDTVEDKIVPCIEDYLKTFKQDFEEKLYSVSEIGEVDSLGSIGRDVTLKYDNRTVIIRFEVLDSTEYEGEMLGYNVKLSAVGEYGTILVKRIPNNYTDSVWTRDIEVLENRVKNMEPITEEDLAQ